MVGISCISASLRSDHADSCEPAPPPSNSAPFRDDLQAPNLNIVHLLGTAVAALTSSAIKRSLLT